MFSRGFVNRLHLFVKTWHESKFFCSNSGRIRSLFCVVDKLFTVMYVFIQFYWSVVFYELLFVYIVMLVVFMR